jgi:glycosyltransferase involved in cell wall biosynthesis
VRERVPNAELVIAGDGPLRAGSEQLATRLGLHVTFAGELSADQVREQLTQARVLCLPSVEAANGDAEGFGLVLLEAQACGVPVVSSARGGAGEGLVEGMTGFRVDERDVGGLADRLTRVLADDAALAGMSTRAVDFTRRHFDIERCTAILEDTYDACLNMDPVAAA